MPSFATKVPHSYGIINIIIIIIITQKTMIATVKILTSKMFLAKDNSTI